MTPTERTLKALKEMGRYPGIVERFIPIPGTHGIRKDLFGIIDIIALDHREGIIGVQSTGQDFSGHWRKLTGEKRRATWRWLMTPGTALELWGWRKLKVKRGGKRYAWTPRISRIYLKDVDPDFLLSPQQVQKRLESIPGGMDIMGLREEIERIRA